MPWQIALHHNANGLVLDGSVKSLRERIDLGHQIRIVASTLPGRYFAAIQPSYLQVFTAQGQESVTAQVSYLDWSVQNDTPGVTPPDGNAMASLPHKLIACSYCTSGRVVYTPDRGRGINIPVAIAFERQEMKWFFDA